MNARDRTSGGIGGDAGPGSDGPISLVGSVVAGGLAFLAYLWLAPPVAGAGDSSELTIALARNGVPHPTGYPLYTLLGHLFVVLLHRLGAGWDYAANAQSALGGGIAVGLMHALARRLVPPGAQGSRRMRDLPALIPVALFALNPVWTDVTTLAEVYSWHVAWAMGAALAFLGLMRSLTDEARTEREGDASPAPTRPRAQAAG